MADIGPIDQYDFRTLTVTVTNAGGSVRDITNDRIIFKINGLGVTKDSNNGAGEVEKTNPAGGIAKVKINAGDLAAGMPGTYDYEVVVIGTGVRSTVTNGTIETARSVITTT